MAKTSGYENIYHHSSTIKKYFESLVTALKAAKDYEHKVVYLEALFNTRLDEVVPYFEKVLKEHWLKDKDLTLTAMWGIYPMIAYDPDKVYEIYWPIMTNHKMHTYLRIVAYYLITESNPSASRLMNIYWYMHKEQNHLLYQFFYKHVHNMAKTTNTCKQHLKNHMKGFVKYLNSPNYYGMTGYYQMDFNNPKYNYGAGVNSFYVHDEETILLKMTTFMNVYNVLTNPTTYIVKIRGVGDISLNLKTTDPTNMFGIDKLHDILKGLKKNDKFYVEIVQLSNDFVVQTYHYNSKNFDYINSFLQGYYNRHAMTIKYQVMNKIFLPTEMGFTAALDIIMPVVERLDIKHKMEFEKTYSLHTEGTVHVWSHSHKGLSFYNFFTDLWQGVNIFVSYDATHPMNLDLTLNKEVQNVRLSIKRHKNESEDIGGYRFHISQATYVRDDFDYEELLRTAPQSKHYAEVIFDQRNKKSVSNKKTLNVMF